jgi:hypothetical protein
LVIREISNPCVEEFNSSKADALGAVVPIPALPVAGKIFVCESEISEEKTNTVNTKR